MNEICGSNHRPTVYVLDDDPAIRDSLVALLDAAGFQTRVYSDGKGLLADPPASAEGCLLIDLCLPDQDGLTVLTELRARGIEAPAILMTAHCERIEKARAGEARPFAVFPKPIPGDVLLDTIEQALGEQGIAASAAVEARHQCGRGS